MTRTRALALLIAAVVYLILPTDLVPDFAPFVGWLDDLIVILVSGWVFWNQWGRKGRFPGGTRPPPAEAAPEDPCAVLGIARGASREEIRKAYREQMSRYHPDKVEHLGPELKRVAHERSVAIQKAYRALLGEEA